MLLFKKGSKEKWFMFSDLFSRSSEASIFDTLATRIAFSLAPHLRAFPRGVENGPALLFKGGEGFDKGGRYFGAPLVLLKEVVYMTNLNYDRKIDYALSMVRKGKATSCTQ
jgi:hypothetical protein